MKTTIHGFRQDRLVLYGMDNDDALILRWFVDFKDSGKMASKIIEEDKYYWIKYEGLLDDLVILKIKTKDALYRRLKKMEKQKILKRQTVKENGTYSFYTLGDNYKFLIENISNLSETNPIQSEINPTGYGNKSDRGTEINPEQKISLLNNTSLLNNNKKEKKKTDLDILINEYTSNSFLQETIIDFMKMRKSIKKPVTERALKGILNKLDKLATTDDIKIKILENSIENCWQGVFPLKDNFSNYNSNKHQDNNNSNILEDLQKYQGYIDPEKMKPVSQDDLDEIDELQKELDEMGGGSIEKWL
ncbi:MAG: hypothetical protein E6517_00125 [Intestinibacter bartlettii]|nr:hypothetical protein [Intestinibacter bartlettii]